MSCHIWRDVATARRAELRECALLDAILRHVVKEIHTLRLRHAPCHESMPLWHDMLYADACCHAAAAITPLRYAMLRYIFAAMPVLSLFYAAFAFFRAIFFAAMASARHCHRFS